MRLGGGSLVAGQAHLVGARGMREVSAADDGNSCREAGCGAMLLEELRPAPGEGLSVELIIPQVGKSTLGATETAGSER